MVNKITLNWTQDNDYRYKVGNDITIKDARSYINDINYTETSREATSWANASRHECCEDNKTVDNLRRILNGLNRYKNKNNYGSFLYSFSRDYYPSLATANSMFDAVLNRFNDPNSKLRKEYQNAYLDYNNARNYLDIELPSNRAKNIKIIENYIKDLESIKTNTNNLITQSSSNIGNFQNVPIISDQLQDASSKFANKMKAELINLKNLQVGNLNELHNAIILENKVLDNQKSNILKNTTTKDRNSEFLNTKNEYIGKIYTILFYSYFLFLFVFVYVLFFIQKDTSITMKLLYIILLGAFPFYIAYVELYLLDLWNYIYSFISGTVYNSVSKTIVTSAKST